MKGFFIYIGVALFIILFFEIAPNLVLDSSIGPYFDATDPRSGGNLGVVAEHNLLKSISHIVTFVLLLWLFCIGWLIKIIYLKEENEQVKYLLLFFGFIVVPLTALLDPVLRYLPIWPS